jgi:hypothetical protein
MLRLNRIVGIALRALVMHMQSLNRHALILPISVVSCVVLANRAVAQDVSMSALESAVERKTCLSGARVEILSPYDLGCKTICVNHKLDGGDCGPGGLVGYAPECQADVDKANKTIRAYNGACSESHSTPKTQSPSLRVTATPPPTRVGPAKQDDNSLSSALDRARRKADKTDGGTRQINRDMMKAAAPHVEERKRQDERAKAIFAKEEKERQRFEEERRLNALRQEQIRHQIEEERAASAAAEAIMSVIGSAISGAQTIPRNSPGEGRYSSPSSSGSTSSSGSSSNPGSAPTQPNRAK